LPSDIEDGERTGSDLFPGDDGADRVVVESVDEVVDDVIVEEDATTRGDFPRADLQGSGYPSDMEDGCELLEVHPYARTSLFFL
jgi:hypothetical protein